MTHSILLMLAGLMGAAGVALAAAAAHGTPGAGLDSAANMLLFHAPALLALGLAARGRLLPYAGLALALGVALFSGDLMARDFLGNRLFPMAAPAGGVIMIVGWLMVAVGAFTLGRNRQ